MSPTDSLSSLLNDLKMKLTLVPNKIKLPTLPSFELYLGLVLQGCLHKQSGGAHY